VTSRNHAGSSSRLDRERRWSKGESLPSPSALTLVPLRGLVSGASSQQRRDVGRRDSPRRRRPSRLTEWRSSRPERPLAYNRGMRRALDVALIAGFLAVDFLFFHDLFKTGEVTTLPQYMTGLLSILVIAICAQSLLKSGRH
jgi:hypothetical protein